MTNPVEFNALLKAGEKRFHHFANMQSIPGLPSMGSMQMPDVSNMWGAGKKVIDNCIN